MYKCLTFQEVSINNFKIVPIRYIDRYDILNWRNEQLYHLRQTSTLSESVQDDYFNNVISKIFLQDNPDQILFSYIKDEKCIGYGGLVHINWIDKNAEISFLMKTQEELNNFELHWSNFLYMIEKIAFNNINLHKIYTYAFDLRPNLYDVLEKNGYSIDAVLNQHCFYNNKFINVIIHSKFNL